MPHYVKRDVLKALEIEKALSLKLAEALPGVADPRESEAQRLAYEASCRRVEALTKVHGEADDWPEDTGMGEF